MKRIAIIVLLAAVTLCSCSLSGVDTYKKLNSRAAEEYLRPVRPGGVDGSPFWNLFSPKFTYAPAFDFALVEGAHRYRLDFFLIDRKFSNPTLPVPENRPSPQDLLESFKAGGEFLTSFETNNPQSALTPVWGELPVANLGVVAIALDASGNEIAICGAREFLKDFPFEGPYPPAPRDYEKSARLALGFLETEPLLAGVEAMDENLVLPDEAYRYYCGLFGSPNFNDGALYLSKFGGAAISVEVALARVDTVNADKHVSNARKCAAFVMKHSMPEDSSLPYLVPTYFCYDRDIDILMSMDSQMAGDALLNLYDITGDELYLDRTIKMMRTYDCIIDEDGYVPKLLYKSTGKGVYDDGALTGDLLVLLQRLHNDYGITEFDSLISRCEKYMYEVSLPQFDFSGQFEDVSVNLMQYQDLTQVTANAYVRYLLGKDNRTEQDVAYAEEMIRFCEDQFIHWDFLSNGKIVPFSLSPGVFEQYYCAICIDASNARMADCMLDYYEVTGDELMFEKAKALVDAIVVSQNAVSGEIPTFWETDYKRTSLWINCCLRSVQVISRLGQLVEVKKSL